MGLILIFITLYENNIRNCPRKPRTFYPFLLRTIYLLIFLDIYGLLNRRYEILLQRYGKYSTPSESKKQQPILKFISDRKSMCVYCVWCLCRVFFTFLAVTIRIIIINIIWQRRYEFSFFFHFLPFFSMCQSW